MCPASSPGHRITSAPTTAQTGRPESARPSATAGSLVHTVIYLPLEPSPFPTQAQFCPPPASLLSRSRHIRRLHKSTIPLYPNNSAQPITRLSEALHASAKLNPPSHFHFNSPFPCDNPTHDNPNDQTVTTRRPSPTQSTRSPSSIIPPPPPLTLLTLTDAVQYPTEPGHQEQYKHVSEHLMNEEIPPNTPRHG